MSGHSHADKVSADAFRSFLAGMHPDNDRLRQDALARENWRTLDGPEDDKAWRLLGSYFPPVPNVPPMHVMAVRVRDDDGEQVADYRDGLDYSGYEELFDEMYALDGDCRYRTATFGEFEYIIVFHPFGD